MAIRTDFTAGEVLAAADLNDTFGAKLNLAGGKILQIVRATDGTDRSTTSTSFVDVTGMSVTITPQKSTSAILVLAYGSFRSVRASSGENGSRFVITDSSNNAISGGTVNNLGNNTEIMDGGVSMLAYATPGTTSATTYKLRFNSQYAGVTTNLFNSSMSVGQMYAIEVSA